MKIDRLQWDITNIEHIARHRITYDEVMEVCFGTHQSKKDAGAKQRYRISGQTSSGRYIHIILEKIKGTYFRPITAFEMTQKQKYKYHKQL